jgi:SWI/SNF-related matrix-associated actin-dependent regulator of chromatin subfamily A-like protein 1
VFSPRAMSQMSMRIANLNNTRQGIVRVSALRGSIDEAIQEALIRLFTTIEKILED